MKFPFIVAHKISHLTLIMNQGKQGYNKITNN